MLFRAHDMEEHLEEQCETDMTVLKRLGNQDPLQRSAQPDLPQPTVADDLSADVRRECKHQQQSQH